MLLYLLKFSACLAIFLLFYKIMLERENMHVFKRYYLLGSLFLSLCIPMIVFTEYVIASPIPTSEGVTFVEAMPEMDTQNTVTIAVDDLSYLFFTVYTLGVICFGFKFLRNLGQLGNRIRKNPKLKFGNLTNVLLGQVVVPHTFFSYIFLNKTQFEANEIPKSVLLHEAAHAKQKHSLDVLIVELLQIVLWFHPLVYAAKRSIKLNHEFLADRSVVNNGIQPSLYQHILLAFSSQAFTPQLANPIVYSSTRLTLFGKTFTFGRSAVGQVKKRISVMKKQTSKKSIVLRSLLLLPMLAILLVGFSETEQVAIPIASTGLEAPIIIAGDLQISLTTEGQLYVGDQLVAIQALESYLLRFNAHLTKTEKANVVRAAIYPEANAPILVLKKIEKILKAYGVAMISIIGPENRQTPPTQKGASEEELKTYNTMAQKYNAVPIEKRIIKRTELERLEIIYRKMSDAQKEDAQSFPECPPLPPQEGVSRALMAEYNKLAKHYNSMDGNHMKIKGKDVERLEYIYGQMSEKQKADAEPFPDFPEPPMPPKAPKTAKTPKAAKAPKEAKDPKEPKAPKAPKAPKVEKGNKSTLIPAPALSPEVVQVVVPKQNVNVAVIAEVPEVETALAAPGGPVTVPVPPLPPEPKSPLDHVIEMAKKGAIFYYEDKEVSSDRAIAIMKKNKNINIDSRGSNSERPVVKLSNEPVFLEN